MKSKMFNKDIKFLFFLILFLFTLTANIFATKDINSQENQENQEIQFEEPTPKSRNSIEAYSTGTIYKEIAQQPFERKKAGSATNDGGFPGDPGQLPVGDGFILLLGAGIIYFINRKNHFIKRNHE